MKKKPLNPSLRLKRLTLRQLDQLTAAGDPWNSMLCLDTKDTVFDETCHRC